MTRYRLKKHVADNEETHPASRTSLYHRTRLEAATGTARQQRTQRGGRDRVAAMAVGDDAEAYPNEHFTRISSITGVAIQMGAMSAGWVTLTWTVWKR